MNGLDALAHHEARRPHRARRGEGLRRVRHDARPHRGPPDGRARHGRARLPELPRLEGGARLRARDDRSPHGRTHVPRVRREGRPSARTSSSASARRAPRRSSSAIRSPCERRAGPGGPVLAFSSWILRSGLLIAPRRLRPGGAAAGRRSARRVRPSAGCRRASVPPTSGSAPRSRTSRATARSSRAAPRSSSMPAALATRGARHRRRGRQAPARPRGAERAQGACAAPARQGERGARGARRRRAPATTARSTIPSRCSRGRERTRARGTPTRRRRPIARRFHARARSRLPSAARRRSRPGWS